GPAGHPRVDRKGEPAPPPRRRATDPDPVWLRSGGGASGARPGPLGARRLGRRHDPPPRRAAPGAGRPRPAPRPRQRVGRAALMSTIPAAAVPVAGADLPILALALA